MTDQTTDQADTAETFDQHCILELMGHRRLAGRVREVQLAGSGFLRLDMPEVNGHSAVTQYIAPGSLYALHPVTEDVARRVAAAWRPEPVRRWELPEPEPERERVAVLHDEDDDEDDEGGLETAGEWGSGPF